MRGSRRRSVVTLLLGVMALNAADAAHALADPVAKTQAATPEGSRSKAPQPEKPGALPIEQQPYRIKAVVSLDPSTRFDYRRRELLLINWLTFIHRFVGAPWQVEIDQSTASEALTLALESLTAEDVLEAHPDLEVEKLWLIRLQASGSGFVLTGREFDVTTGRLGSMQRRSTPYARDLVRSLFLFAIDLFSPYAQIGERFGKDVFLSIRGAALPAASPIGQIVRTGAIFQPLRVVPQKEKRPIVRDITYTFLRVEEPQSTGARCSVVSVYSDPFTKRVVQKTSLAALGIKPGKSPTRLRFLTLPHRAPAAGYVLTARRFPEGNPRELGTTDREGRITLEPGISEGLLIIRLLAGSSEPMIEFPLMPGESADERTIPPFNPKPRAVALETQLDSLRDEIIDLVAIRARLEARIKARFDGEDWPGAEEALKEYQSLMPRDLLSQRLNKLKDEATKQQVLTKTPILTKTAQAQISELQNLLDRYLDDEAFKGYSDALVQIKAGAVLKKPNRAESDRTETAARKTDAPPDEPPATPAPQPVAAPTPAPPPRPAAPTSTVPF